MLSMYVRPGPQLVHQADAHTTLPQTSTNKVTMQYNTCLTYFLNQDFNTLTYCRTEWVSPLRCRPRQHG